MVTVGMRCALKDTQYSPQTGEVVAPPPKYTLLLFMTSNPYITHLQQKGYTEQEIRQGSKSAKVVPDWYAASHPHDTYEEYQDALHDFLNGM